MTTTNHTKVLKQIKDKPGKYAKYLKNNQPKERTYGVLINKCRLCGNTHAHIGKYGLDICRRCFRQHARELGFKQYS